MPVEGRELKEKSSISCIIAFRILFPTISTIHFFSTFYCMTRNIVFSIIVIIVSIFVVAFAMTTYRYYQAIHSDDPIDPYILVEK
jgi:hypothetical protein